jgi:DNA mismatch repair protein MutS
LSIDKNTNEGKNYRNNVVKSTSGTSKSRINTGFPEDISVLSPMMKEYVKTKEEYSDCILFYRLGDFYEMFFEDALTASRELEITLTGKDCGLEERAPMCGVPFHAAETYINRLIEKGYKVAICEQVEDPKKASCKTRGCPHCHTGNYSGYHVTGRVQKQLSDVHCLHWRAFWLCYCRYHNR